VDIVISGAANRQGGDLVRRLGWVAQRSGMSPSPERANPPPATLTTD
jgi:hypothetical protein